MCCWRSWTWRLRAEAIASGAYGGRLGGSERASMNRELHDPHAPRRPVQEAWARGALLLLTLLAFGRALWGLDAKALWWDESLSLQRAELPWGDLILGRLYLYDGLYASLTYDQHPFFSFLLQGLLVRLAGNSEFVLRLPSAMAATLLVPVVWSLARAFTRRGVFAVGAPLWAALLAAVHPFFLWYGQEARPYALWAVLALISTYALWQAVSGRGDGNGGRGWWLGYALSAAMFYTTHFYAVFLLPVQAWLLAARLWQRSRRLALLVLGGPLLLGAAVGGWVYWSVVIRQGGGGNFPEVPWTLLGPDLLNAFSLGLSVDLADVWWLDVIFGVVALVGAIGCVAQRPRGTVAGWLPIGLVLGPVAVLLVAMTVYPAYMNARHMSVIGGGFVLLLGAGLARMAQFQVRRRSVGVLLAGGVAALLVGGMAVSMRNYFTMEEYAKDDFRAVGAYLRQRLAPGDALLIKSPFAWRAFTYYLDLPPLRDGQPADAPLAVYGVPFLGRSWAEREALLPSVVHGHRRIWLVVSNTHPYMDLEGRTEMWLDEHLFKVKESTYFSHSSLRSAVYLDEVPVYEGLPPQLATPVEVVLGDLIRVVGIEVGRPAQDDLALPVTIYWQTERRPDAAYKYILTLEEVMADGSARELARTEREPYDGATSTLYWDPGKTIVEYTELPPTAWPRPVDAADAARYRVRLQVYHAELWDKLPVSRAVGVAAQGDALWVPYWTESAAGR